MASRSTEFRVGLFVVTALLIGGSLAFVIGSQRNFFQSKSTYKALFDDVGGLRVGNTVRIAGVDVGTVSGVELQDSGQIKVEFSVVDDAAHLIRRGSIARIGNKGMLGDRLLDISVGDGERLQPGATLPTGEEVGLAALLSGAGSVVADARGTLRNMREATEPFGDEAFQEDVRTMTKNLAKVSKMAAEGDGTFQALLTDREMLGRVDRSLTSLDEASAELARTSRSVRAIADEVRSGDGTAHELVYGQDGVRLIRNAADASGEIATVLRDVREGDGTLHDLVYEDDADDLLANLTAASSDIRQITADIRAGRGTLGGLLTDPSIYEDIKRLIGDLQRNEILRALVRYSIRRDEAREPAPQPEEEE